MNETKQTEQALLDQAKQKRSNFMNAFLIGLFIGVIIYGVAKNNIGFFGLIPIFIAFIFLNKPKGNNPSDE